MSEDDCGDCLGDCVGECLAQCFANLCVDCLCAICDCFCYCCRPAPPVTIYKKPPPITTQYYPLTQPNPEYGTFPSESMQPVKMIAFGSGQIEEREFYYNPQIVQNVKIIDFLDAKFEGEFYETALKYCNRMNHLAVRYYCETFSDVALMECTKIGVKNQWQQQKYATLEHLCWDAYKLPEQLDILFQVNPNIKSFQTGSHIFSETLELFIQSGIKVDEFIVELKHIPDRKLLEEYFMKLDMIHDRQQFKSLMMSLPTLGALENPRLTRLTYLNGICCEVSENDVHKINEMLNLKLLIIKNKKTQITPSMAEALSKQLNNLEALYLCINSIEQIAPFICNLPKLQHIFVYNTDKISKSVEISLLNKERMKMKNACKINVYLPDLVYSEMKCEKKKLPFNMWNKEKNNFSLIALELSTPEALKHPFVINTLRSYIISKN